MNKNVNEKKYSLRDMMTTLLISLGLFGAISFLFMNCKIIKKSTRGPYKKTETPLDDNQPPIIEWTQVPNDHTQDQTVIISFSVTDNKGVSSILCSLDQTTFQTCNIHESKTLTNLNVGPHDFTVIATDTSQNTISRTHSWTVTASPSEPGDPHEPPRPDVPLCNPFINDAGECTINSGLVGYAYYLTPSFLRQPPLEPFAALLDDYVKHGEQLTTPLHISQINMPNMSNEKGFPIGSGELLRDSNGQLLTMWFSVRLRSLLRPNTGTEKQQYEFAMLSDDGMRVLLDGEVILEDDGAHMPRWTCTQKSYEFSPSMKKNIEVHYFQGYRNFMAMQLMYRMAGSHQGCPPPPFSSPPSPPLSMGWEIIPESFFVIE